MHSIKHFISILLNLHMVTLSRIFQSLEPFIKEHIWEKEPGSTYTVEKSCFIKCQMYH